MITRVVKLTIRKGCEDEFAALFSKIHSYISAFDGCLEVKLFETHNCKGEFFTISNWESETALEAYRKSGLFENIWPEAKKLFNSKAEAWTLFHVSQKDVR